MQKNHSSLKYLNKIRITRLCLRCMYYALEKNTVAPGLFNLNEMFLQKLVGLSTTQIKKGLVKSFQKCYK